MKAKKIISKVCEIGEYIAAVIIAGLAVLIGVNVLMRRFLNAPIYGSTELVQYGTLAAVSLAAANTTWRGDHPCVGLLIDALKPIPRTIMNIITDTASVVIWGLVTFNLWPYFMEQFHSSRTTETLFIPYWIISGLILFCIFATFVVVLLRLIFDIMNIVKPETYEEKVRDISLEGAGLIADATAAADEINEGGKEG